MVIDLDAHPPAAVVPRRSPVRPAVLIVVLLTVLGLGGSAPPGGLRQVLLVSNTTGAYALTPAALFTADFGRRPGRQSTIRGHPLDGSSGTWAIDLPQAVGALSVVESAGVLVVHPPRVLLATSADQPRTTFVDSRSGTVLWRPASGRVLSVSANGALITGRDGGDPVLRRVDLRTGRVLSSQAHGTTEEPAPDPVAPRCHTAGGHLACPVDAGRIGVWRLPG